MPDFFILGFWGWDFVTNLSNGVIKQTDKAVNRNTTSGWSPKLLHFFFFFALSFYPICLPFLKTCFHALRFLFPREKNAGV